MSYIGERKKFYKKARDRTNALRIRNDDGIVIDNEGHMRFSRGWKSQNSRDHIGSSRIWHDYVGDEVDYVPTLNPKYMSINRSDGMTIADRFKARKAASSATNRKYKRKRRNTRRRR